MINKFNNLRLATPFRISCLKEDKILIITIFTHLLIIQTMSEKEEKKSMNEYDELKGTRHKSLIKQFEDYLLNLKVYASMENSQLCTKLAFKDGQIDEIDQKVCLKAKEKELNVNIMRILPELTQHANNYEQCLNQCAKNHISYVVANQSCKAVYEKNFRLTTTSITERLLGRKQF